MGCKKMRTVMLKDIADITMGQSPKGDTLNSSGEGVPFMQGNRTFGLLYPTIDTYTTSPTKMARCGDVVMSVRAPVGDLNLAPVDFCLGRGVCSLRAKSLGSSFLFYVLKNNRRRLALGGNGTVFTSVNRKELSSFQVEIPESAECCAKIAVILSAIDSKIELNNRLNDYLAEMALVLFCKTVMNAGEAITYETIGSFCNVKGGKRLPKNSELTSERNAHPYIRVRDLNKQTVLVLTKDMLYVDDETQKSIERYIVNSSDLIISVVGTIGLTALIGESLDGANLTENCNKLTNFTELSPEWVYAFFNTFEGGEAIRAATVGAVQAKLPLKNIKAIEVPVVPQEQLGRTDIRLRAIYRTIHCNAQENQRLAELRDILLPRLMSGEIDISNVDPMQLNNHLGDYLG